MKYSDIQTLAMRAGFAPINAGNGLGGAAWWNGGHGVGNVMTTTRTLPPVSATMLPGSVSQNGITIERAGFNPVNAGNGLGGGGMGNTNMPGMLGDADTDCYDSGLATRSHPLSGVGGGLGSDYGSQDYSADVITSGDYTANPTTGGALPVTSALSTYSTAGTGTSTDYTGAISSVITSLASATVAALAPTAYANSQLAQTNATRLAEGLPPLNANGTPMSAAQMAAAGYTSSQISSVSSQLAGSSTMLLILGAAAIGAIALIATRKNA